jgi:hypothetical protein
LVSLRLPPSPFISLCACRYDPPWLNIEHADHTGFCGLTSLADVRGYCDPECFHEAGFAQWIHDQSTGGRHQKVLDSPIVCFESKGPTEMGLHTAIMVRSSPPPSASPSSASPSASPSSASPSPSPSPFTLIQVREGAGDFPPNTLFRLKRTVPPGEWQAPGGVYPKQKLVVVSATYRMPRGVSPADADADTRTKLCATPVTLEYAGRHEYVHGLEDIITSPVFTMEQEFTRDVSWRDWKGVYYTLRSEWAYVNGPAMRKENCTVGAPR